MDCRLPGFSVQGISQARILEWVDFLLQEIFPTQGLNPSLPHCRQTLYHLSHQGITFVFLITAIQETQIPVKPKVFWGRGGVGFIMAKSHEAIRLAQRELQLTLTQVSKYVSLRYDELFWGRMPYVDRLF